MQKLSYIEPLVERYSNEICFIRVNNVCIFFNMYKQKMFIGTILNPEFLVRDIKKLHVHNSTFLETACNFLNKHVSLLGSEVIQFSNDITNFTFDSLVKLYFSLTGKELNVCLNTNLVLKHKTENYFTEIIKVEGDEITVCNPNTKKFSIINDINDWIFTFFHLNSYKEWSGNNQQHFKCNFKDNYYIEKNVERILEKNKNNGDNH